MALPEFFVWTRYGTESGEVADSILARKERERQLAGGVFLWGIGNSVGPSVRRLLEHLQGRNPTVLFSPMLGAPRGIDVDPEGVVAWSSAKGIDERDWDMPPGTLVTSRNDAGSNRKSRHYALVCQRDEPLDPNQDGERFAIDDLANFASGNRVGHSQVTSVVRRVGQPSKKGPYVAAIRATLVYPYVVELTDPVPVDSPSASSGRCCDKKLARQATFDAFQ